MANEARVTANVTISKGNLKYNPKAISFQATVTGTNGPTPGAFTATPTGIDIDLSKLDTPGLAIVRNYDSTYYLTVGVRDPETNKFYPFMEVLPGEAYPLRLSRMFGWEYGVGTGTDGAQTNVITIRTDGATCNGSFECFEV